MLTVRPSRSKTSSFAEVLAIFDYVIARNKANAESGSEDEESTDGSEDESEEELSSESDNHVDIHRLPVRSPIKRQPQKVDLSQYEYLQHTNISNIKLYHYIRLMLEEGVNLTEPLLLSGNIDCEEFVTPDGDVLYDTRIYQYVVSLWERTGLIQRLVEITDEEVIAYLTTHQPSPELPILGQGICE